MERMPYYLDASAGPHFPSEIRLDAPSRHTRLSPVLTLTLCRLEREADFRGGVFFGLNVFPKRGIFGLTKARSMLPCPRVRTSQGHK